MGCGSSKEIAPGSSPSYATTSSSGKHGAASSNPALPPPRPGTLGNYLSPSQEDFHPDRTLYVIVPYFNPIGYRRRQALYVQFCRYLEAECKRMWLNTPWRLFTIRVELEHVGPGGGAVAAAASAAMGEGEDPVPDTGDAAAPSAPPADSSASASAAAGSGSGTVPSLRVQDLQGKGIVLTYSSSSDNVMWHKENLINLGMRWLMNSIPQAKHLAWLDSDISFRSEAWLSSTLKVLQAEGNETALVQMFEAAVLLGPDGKTPTHTVKGFAFQLAKGVGYQSLANTHPGYWHPGFAWAANVSAMRSIMTAQGTDLEALPETSLGGADRTICMACIDKLEDTLSPGFTQEYKASIRGWGAAAKLKKLKLRYCPGSIEHYFHGDLADRGYVSRNDILVKHQFKPAVHLRLTGEGLLEWSSAASAGLKRDVRRYFEQRNEDSTEVRTVQMPASAVSTVAAAGKSSGSKQSHSGGGAGGGGAGAGRGGGGGAAHRGGSTGGMVWVASGVTDYDAGQVSDGSSSGFPHSGSDFPFNNNNNNNSSTSSNNDSPNSGAGAGADEEASAAGGWASGASGDVVRDDNWGGHHHSGDGGDAGGYMGSP